MSIVDDEYVEKYLAYLKMIKPNLLQYITIIMYSNNYNTNGHEASCRVNYFTLYIKEYLSPVSSVTVDNSSVLC